MSKLRAFFVTGSLAAGLCARSAFAQGTTTIPSALRDVVHYNAPIVIAEASSYAQMQAEGRPAVALEQMVRVDLDANNNGSDNNARVTSNPYGIDHSATVYYSAHETGYSSDQGYFFLTYYWYHVNDGGFDTGIAYDPGHQHDLEGVMLIVKKSAYTPFGNVAAALTEAHGALIPWFGRNAGVDNRAAVGGMGYVETWADSRYNYNWSRPVVAVTARDHGTYMAQNCNPALQGQSWDEGFGAWLGSETSGYTACLHDGRTFMRYMPEMAEAVTYPWAYPQPDTPDPYWLGPGPVTYQLLEVRQTPFWSLANADQNWFAGQSLVSPYGFTGREHFYASSDDIGGGNGANPMWQWRGGTGNCPFGYCYYSFGEDSRNSYHSPANWPQSPYYGELLLHPASEAVLRFPYLPETNAPYRYNPYLASPPDYNVPPSDIYAYIDGPGTVAPGSTNTWSTNVNGGSAPYNVQWSGVVVGTGTSVTGTVSSSGYLYLDIWDSAGAHFTTSTYVTIDPCASGPNAC